MNIVELFLEQSQKHSFKDAIIWPKRSLFSSIAQSHSLTFSELSKMIFQNARGFLNSGIRKGDKVLVFLKPSFDFPAATFSLFYIGAVPVFIDPGMGRENLLKAIKEVSPKALIAEDKVFFYKFFLRKTFSSVKISLRKKNLLKFKENSSDILNVPEVLENDLAAILFTSGGTGVPKGVEYTHKIFLTQTRLLEKLFSLNSEDIDFPCFPLFALFTLSMGMTVVIPDMDASKPASCNPQKIVDDILFHRPTFAAGSPAIWDRVANYCLSREITLPSIKTLAMFGAPVSMKLHKKFQKILIQGTTATPYGATECLPVSLTTGDVLLKDFQDLKFQDFGTCIGKVVPETEVRIIPNIKAPIEDISEVSFLPPHKRGEIIVKGIQATKNYLKQSQTEQAKIGDKETGEFWHRMGDLGHFDNEGNLWFCGRKDHLVETIDGELYSIPCESVFNHHPNVKKSALVGINGTGSKKLPAIVIEPKNKNLGDKQKKALFRELRDLGKQYSHTKDIKHFGVMEKLPIDVRHNIKIDRPLVAKKMQNRIQEIQQ